jgi:hypothetical protein
LIRKQEKWRLFLQDSRNATPELRLIYDDYDRHVDSHSVPGVLTNLLITAALTAAMPGVGTGLTATLTQAGFSAAASQVAIGTLSNGGDLGAGLRGVLSRDGLRNIGMAMATAGLMEGIEQALPESLKGAQSLTTQRSIEQHLASGLGKSIAGGLAGTAFGRGFDVEDVLGTGFVAGLGAFGANNIGDWYFDGDIPYAAHKGLHFGLGFGLGAGMGSLMDRDHWLQSGISGGTAATVAEMMAEVTMGDMRAIREGRGNPSKMGSFLSQAVGTIVGSLIIEGADPMMAARNAVENNYLEMVKRADGTVDIRVVDDERYPEDAMHLIFEDSETGQTKSWWSTQYVPGEESLLAPKALTFLSMGGAALLSDDLRLEVRQAYLENPTLYEQNLHSQYQDAKNAYLSFRRSIVDAANFQGFKSQHPEMRSLMDIQLGWGDVLSAFMPATELEAGLLLAAGPMIKGGAWILNSGASRLLMKYGPEIQNFYKTPLGVSLSSKLDPYHRVLGKTVAPTKKIPEQWRITHTEIPGIIPNNGGKVRTFHTNKDETYYRVYSGSKNTGGYLVKTPPKNRECSLEGLALPPSNTATHIQQVVVPAGTLLRRSRVVGVKGWGRGGLEQFRILSEISESSFKSGRLFLTKK